VADAGARPPTPPLTPLYRSVTASHLRPPTLGTEAVRAAKFSRARRTIPARNSTLKPGLTRLKAHASGAKLALIAVNLARSLVRRCGVVSTDMRPLKCLRRSRGGRIKPGSGRGAGGRPSAAHVSGQDGTQHRPDFDLWVEADTIAWFADEARVGQKIKITRRWAKRGTRPSAPSDQRTASTYIFGAICPKEGKAVGLILPRCNIEAMQLHLDEIAKDIEPGRHAVLMLDKAGWHTSPKLDVPENLTLLPLPAKCPELNPVENVWEFMRDNWLSNRIFLNYDDIVDHCCDAWNKLRNQPWRVMSIGLRDWAHKC
jgi:transposase